MFSSIRSIPRLFPFIPNYTTYKRSMATLSDWNRVASVAVPPYSVFAKTILKSPQDDREYRVIRLENGLEAMVIHDAKADKAAASINVAVGHLSDPDDMPGLAHFCEHLLFMGTEQFPKENEYSEFLAKNNGASNAYTATSNTNYYFNVSTAALPGALTRFAAFFHSPLFSPSCTSRELNAVDSEHKKNHQADMWRIFQLNKHLSKEGHVWRKFGSGNRESLSRVAKELKSEGKLGEPVTTSKSLAPSPIPSRLSSPAPSTVSTGSDSEADGGSVGRETRRRLVEWWYKEYCASRMRLCVIGKESLDELADLVSTLFSPIPNRGQDPLPMITEHPFGPNEISTLVKVQTIMSFHCIEMSFPLDWQPPFYRHKPAYFISHFAGHEGPGSLHSYLKSKGWITALSSGPQDLARGFGMFKVRINLTEDGFKNYREVMLATHKYLSLLRSADFPAWYQRELSTLSNIGFRFAEKRRPDDYATWVSEHMSWPLPPDLIIAGPQLTWEWDAEETLEIEGGKKKVEELLDGFRVDKGRAVLMARADEFAKFGGGEKWEKEPWYGSDYSVEKFDNEFLKLATGPNDIKELFLPGPNEFIPTNLDVDKRDVAEPLTRPHLIRESPLSTLWHKKDDKFWVPKAHVIVELRSAVANASPRASVLNRLYSDLVSDSLTEFSYDADLAGLSYSFVSHTTGLYITMQGYNDKMAVLARDVLEKAKGLVIDPKRLDVMKEQTQRSWENFFLGQPYQLSDYYGRYLMTDPQWSIEEKLAELPSITAEDVQNYVKELLAQVNLRMLVTGNMFKDEAIRIAEEVEKGLGPSSVPSNELEDHALIIPEGCHSVYVSSLPNLNETNSSLSYYLHIGRISDVPLRVTAALLTQILSEPAFNVLRTKEQLGYIVSCSQWLLAASTDKGIRVVVQSEKPPGYLEKRVDAFLDGMKTTLEEMSAEEFEQQKDGLEKKWSEVDKNLAEETSRFVTHITTGQYDFLRKDINVGALKNITKDDVIRLFMSRVHPSSSSRSTLAVHMRSQKPRLQKVSAAAAQAFETLVADANLGIDATAWKETLGSDPNPSLADFGKYWKSVLEGKAPQDVLSSLLVGMLSLMEKYPVEEEADEVREGARIIEDMKAFKASLKVADPAPVVQWGDLPVPKF